MPDTNTAHGRHPGRWRPVRAVALACALLVLAACGSMPTTGSVQSESRQSVDQSTQSRTEVFPQPPYDGERPDQIVDGFLEALVSTGPANDATVRSYLTPAAAAQWGPSQGTLVVERLNTPAVRPGSLVGGSAVVDLSVTPFAYLDAGRGGYTPASSAQPQTISFDVQQQPNGWRISSAPDQLIISELDFTRIFQAVDLYYASALASSSDVLVPDRVYLPDNASTAQVAVAELLAGPTTWLAPGIDPALVQAGRRVSVISVSQVGGTAKVTLGGATADLSDSERTWLTAEVFWTLAKLSSVGLDSVTLQDAQGKVIAGGAQNAMERFDPDALPADPVAYLLQPAGKNQGDLLRANNSGQQVPGDFGDGTFGLSSAAVSPDGVWAAGVSTDGRTLAVQSLSSAAKPLTVFAGTKLSEPSWDASGNLWVVDQTSTGSVVHELIDAPGAVADGQMPPADVTTVAVDPQPYGVPGGPQLPTPFSVTKLRLATDGTRVVAVAALPQGGSAVLTGVLAKDGSGLRITNLRPIMPQLSDVVDVVWDGPRVLAVLGASQPGQPVQPYLVDVDGGDSQSFNAQTFSSSPPTGLVCIAAAHPDLPSPVPVLVSDGGGVLYQFQPGISTVWTKIGSATCPIYPG